MAFKPSAHKNRTTVAIDLGDAGNFTLKLRTPTYEEQLRDDELFAWDAKYPNSGAHQEYVDHRIRTAVVGWDGLLNDDDTPIPFSVDALINLCNQFPQITSQVEDAAFYQFRGILETEAKNSAAPCSDSSGETSAAQSTPTTQASSATSNSSELELSVSP